MLEVWRDMDGETLFVVLLSLASIVLGVAGFIWFFVNRVKKNK